MSDPITNSWLHGNPQFAVYSTETALGNWSDEINAIDFNVNASSDEKREISMAADDNLQTKRSLFVQKPTEIEISLSEVNRTLVAAALHGSASSLTRASATGETATMILVLGEWVQIVDANGKPVRHVDTAAITDKVEGTDFLTNEELGQIKALTAGGAGSKTVTYNLKAFTGYKYGVATQSAISFSVQMRLKDHATEVYYLVTIPKITVQASEAFKLINMDRQDIKFKGTVIKMPNRELVEYEQLTLTA
jgi:hypothetical protein